MPKDFYDREDELADLNKRLESLKTGEFISIYGRRRVGKTELMKQFLETAQSKKLYFYVDLMERPGLIESMASEITKQLGDAVRFEKWDDFFDYIIQKSSKEKLILVIDEFQRFLEISPEFITKMQRYWDEKLRHNKILIVIVGSSIGMMHRITKSYAAPLYGRISMRTKISPFRYVDFRKMFRSMSEEEKVNHYAVFGGTPYYLMQVKEMDDNIHSCITSLILNKGGKLYEEPAILMESENIRTHARYNAILQAIALGKEIPKEIEDYTHIPSTTLPAYLRRLDDLLDLVYRKKPILGKEKHGRYRLRDNFFSFWYKFVFPNQSRLNLGHVKEVESQIKENMGGYVGHIFENIIHELLLLYSGRQKIKGIEIDFDEVGSWWDRKANEIDIVAYSRKKGNILLGEIKWTNEKVDADLFDDLVRKSKLVNFRGMAKFIMISKSGFTKRCIEKMEQMHCVYLDLTDIEKLFDDAHEKGK